MQSNSMQAFIKSAINDSFFIDRIENNKFIINQPVRLNNHYIILLESANGALTIDEKRHVLKDKELFLIAKGQVCVSEQPLAASGYILYFGECFWEKTPASASNCKAVLFNNAAVNQNIMLPEQELQELLFLFKALREEYVKPNYTNQIDALAAYLKIIMIKIANIGLADGYIYKSGLYPVPKIHGSLKYQL